MITYQLVYAGTSDPVVSAGQLLELLGVIEGESVPPQAVIALSEGVVIAGHKWPVPENWVKLIEASK